MESGDLPADLLANLEQGANGFPQKTLLDKQFFGPASEDVAARLIAEWIEFYNTKRPHSSLDGRTPAEAFAAGRPMDMMYKPDGLPTSPQAQQQQEDMINRIQAA